MAKSLADQNRVGYFFESGLFASPTGTTLKWLGQVQSNTVDESVGIINVRAVGGATRTINQYVDGPLDYTGAVTYYPQDWGMLFFAFGSVYGAGSPSPYSWNFTTLESASGNAFTSGTKNPFPSFTLYDSHKAATSAGDLLNRQLQGCVVNNFKLAWSQGEPISCDIDYVAQGVVYSSGAQTAITASTVRPYMWSDLKLHIPSGTVYDQTTDGTFTLGNNIESPHYANGSRVIGIPVALNADFELSFTLDNDSTRTKTLYDQYFQGGSTFNVLLELTDSSAGAGSRSLFISMSGCKVTDMENPTNVDGVNKQTVTIGAQTASANVIDTNNYYPWGTIAT